MRTKSFTLVLCLLVTPVVVHCQYDYADALEKSLLFYEAQRSGELPASNRIPWRGDSLLNDMVPGGYFDAGDFVKFGFPGAFANTMLAWGGIAHEAGYVQTGQLDHLLDCLEWFTNYHVAAHTSTNELIAQIGDGVIDHDYWGRPEDIPNSMPRPAFTLTTSEPGSDLAGETAAALASSSIVFRNNGMTALADTALSHARELFDFADQYRGIYSDVIPAYEYYPSTSYGDELCWAAMWLYKATNETAYLNMAEDYIDEFGLDYAYVYGHSWDGKLLGAHILLYEATGDSRYGDLIAEAIDFYLNDADYTPGGLLFLSSWGSLPGAANTVFALLQAAELGIQPGPIRTLVRDQVDYMLGSTGRSFVVGFGTNPPVRPHHASSSCPDLPLPCGWDDFDAPGPNPQVLYGALVGGPDENDDYNDERDDYVQNEVTLDYNCGFQGLLAAMITM